MTIAQLAEGAALSRSFISQVESGQTAPSMASMTRICKTLQISLADFFDENSEPSQSEEFHHTSTAPTTRRDAVSIVRKDGRKSFKYPGAESMNYLLVADLKRKMEVILGVMQPGESSEVEAWSHEGEEFGFILEGTFELTVNGVPHILEEGDSIYFPSNLPHSARVIGDRVVRWIWAITPPSL